MRHERRGTVLRTQVSGFRSQVSHRGVTLLELVVVIVILAMLLGLSIGLFSRANRDLGVRASANQLVAILRGAHDHARSTHAPAWVVLHTGENSVYAVTKETVGEWHFEDTVTTGAFGRNARVSNAQHVPARVGMGFRLSGSSSIDCGEVPMYDPNQGIAVEFWIQRGGGTGRQVVCAIGSLVEVALDASARLVATLGSVSMNSGDIHLRSTDAWYYVQLIYDGREAQLFVNHALVASRAGRMSWTKGLPLVLGGSKGGVNGILDEFRVGIVFAREKYELPSEAKFVLPQGYVARGQTEFVIHFDSEGRLDRRKHANPLRIKIQSPTEEKEVIVQTTGLVQR